MDVEPEVLLYELPVGWRRRPVEDHNVIQVRVLHVAGQEGDAVLAGEDERFGGQDPSERRRTASVSSRSSPVDEEIVLPQVLAVGVITEHHPDEDEVVLRRHD